MSAHEDILHVCSKNSLNQHRQLLLAGENTTNMSSIRRHKRVCPGIPTSAPSVMSTVHSLHSPADEKRCSLFPPLHQTVVTTSTPSSPSDEDSHSAFSFPQRHFASSLPHPPKNKEKAVGKRGWNKCKWGCKVSY